MRVKPRPEPDEMRPEYKLDYSTVVRGRYFRRLLEEGANVVVHEPDIAKAFRTSTAVNEALRSLLEVSESTRRLTMRSSGRSRASHSLPPQGARRATHR